MAKQKIFVTRLIPDGGLKLLRSKGYRVVVASGDTPIKRRDLLLGVRGASALISLLTDRIDGEVMDAGLPQLKIISNYAVGFDNIDLPAAKARTILVTNTPGEEVNESVAEHTLALMLGLAHRIVETDKFTRAGKYKAWGPQLLLGTDFIGKTVGIIGLGNIGKSVARRLRDGFGVHILYHTRTRDKEFESQHNARYATLPELLKQSDFVTLHVPLTPETRHLIGAKELRLMKKTAFLINTSRGPVIHELALVKALTKRQIGGAGLDVYECEPLIDCNPHDNYELRKLDNVILTPHTASATVETRQAMSVRAAENIIAALAGRRPATMVRV